MSEYNHIKQLESTIEDQRFALSKISHEIRNPVTLINSSLQLIEQEHPEVASFAFWNETRSDMKYLLRLLEDLSAFNNGQVLHLEQISTSEWLKETAASLKAAVSQIYTFKIDVAEDLPSITADPVKLRQAILNLLRNAFEAISENGSVYFHAHADESNLTITVRDNGCGIPPEYLDDLFKPFITHKSGGTGLGLAITKQIINAHRGKITIHTAPDQGTSFDIVLPLACGK